jgi:hypothetical protein
MMTRKSPSERKIAEASICEDACAYVQHAIYRYRWWRSSALNSDEIPSVDRSDLLETHYYHYTIL